MAKWIGALLLVLVLAAAVWIVLGSATATAVTRARVLCRTGTVTRTAVAVGRVEPEHEVPVKSEHPGIVTELFAQPGQRVRRGEPLLEVRPRVTERAEAEAHRAIETADDGLANVRELRDGENLMGWMMRWMQGRGSLDRMVRAAELGKRRAEEQLELFENGKVEVDGRTVDFVVRAPIDGNVLARPVRVGDPIVASSSYGSGTVLVVLANLDQTVFRGTADEIDVGGLRVGMNASIRVGALPDRVFEGRLAEIALKARSQNNAVVFDVRIAVTAVPGVLLRAGYSAVAEIEIERREAVLTLPERVVDFRDDGAFVRLAGEDGEVRDHRIETGLSDGMIVEVRGGLQEGAAVLERSDP